MLKRLTLSALVLAGFASAAAAGELPASQQQLLTRNPGMPMYDSASYQTKLYRQGIADAPQAEVTPEQRRRAKQAVALIKSNHCEDAYNLALAEHDDRLALNIAVVCKAHLPQ